MFSICMAYFNRKQQLYKTIESINESSVKDYELVIVDDGSDEAHKLNLDELKILSRGTVQLLEIDKVNKTWFNPCIAFNIAFSAASKDKIIIQNPETLHLGDCLNKANELLDNTNYLSFHTIALNKTDTNNLYKHTGNDSISFYMKPIIDNTAHLRPGTHPYQGTTIWYNHKVYRPVHYHFLSAITKENLFKLGGFDERYKDDHSWDDNEFLARIGRLNLNKTFVENPIGIHLYHEIFYSRSTLGGLRNRDLFHSKTLRENNVKAQDLNFYNYKQFLKEI